MDENKPAREVLPSELLQYMGATTDEQRTRVLDMIKGRRGGRLPGDWASKLEALGLT